MKTGVIFMYNHFPKQDKEDLSNLTVDYLDDFSHQQLGMREQWWPIDMIYIGRWKHPDGNPSTFLSTSHGTAKIYHHFDYFNSEILDGYVKAGGWHI
jgi:hypothetical protein